MFSIKPVFVGWIALLYQLPVQLFFTIWSALAFGGIIGATRLFPHGSPTPTVLFGALAFFAVPMVTYFGKKLNYANTEYKFSDDRLELEEGFFTINEKVLKYRDVKEVTLHKNLLQRMCDLGTIYLATEATGSITRPNVFNALGFGNVSASGVGVCDIRDPDRTFARIRSMVDAQAR